VHLTAHDIAVRGERLALARLLVGTADAGPGAPQDEFLQVYGIDELGRISLQIWFDLEDMDAAIAELDGAHARFEQEAHRQTRRLENAASQAAERYFAHFAARDWDALAKVLADDICVDDRRRVVNAGIKHGRDAEIANVRAVVDVGITYFASVVIAARGQRLVLARIEGGGPEEFLDEVLGVIEIDSDNLISTIVLFELDDFDAAVAELDARYLAGEAAAHANTWSVISGGHGALNRRELPPLTPDCVSIDHRRGAAFAPGELTAYFRAGFDLNQDIQTYVEVVHRLSDLGAVCTHAAHGVSHEGFDAEWRGIDLLTIDGDMVNRCEVFDEANLDAALARFDQLSRPAPRLENAASQVTERYMAHFAARDWDELAKVLADDVCTDDRRRIVGAEIKHGRDAEIANLRAAADVGITYFTSVVIAARGERLMLAHLSGGQGGSGEFVNEVLGVGEINSDNLISAIVLFELDDFDAAIEELDARYLAGEAAPYRDVLQPVTDTVGELNRHKPGPMLGRIAFADHRRVPFGSAENYGRAIEELWTLVPDARNWMRAVHALDAHGLVSTLVIEGTDAHGNELQWVRTFLFLSDGPRVEVYEEADLDVALARFDELRPQARRLENAASHACAQHSAHFAARDWDALAKVLADDFVTDDRRRAVNAGIRHGRDAEIANMQAAAEVGVTYTAFVVIATRGERLILLHVSVGGGGSAEFATDALSVVEVNSHNQIAAFVIFELDDFDAAIAELDARYRAGEAAAHAHTWSVITRAISALNRREVVQTTPDWVNIDHRRGVSFGPGELPALLASWNLSPDASSSIEVVHRLSHVGAVVTSVSHETSQEGVNAEWRVISVLTIEDDLINRFEAFDEADIDAAIARFDQLSRPTPRLENAVSRLVEQFLAHFAGRDWDALAELVADDMSSDDRRRVINAGIRLGRDGEMANWRATSDVWTNVNATVIATRGERLALFRFATSQDQPTEGFQGAALSVIEINDDNRAVASVVFDIDDFDAAIAELDARYIAGEAAAQANTWSVITGGYAALNRHELPATTPDGVSMDHRRGGAFAPGELSAYIRAAWENTPNATIHVEVVHRLSSLGAVVTQRAHGVSLEGFDAEWRDIAVMTVDGGLISRGEIFDEADLDAALAKFDELSRARLENSATRVQERVYSYIAAGDWDALAQTTAENVSVDDRRRVVNAGVIHGRDANIESTQATVDVGFTMTMVGALATRGEHLALLRVRVSGRDAETIQNDALNIVEIDVDERIAGNVVFDLDDFDAAVAELDARYVAGEAAAHAGTWSLIAGAFVALNRRELPATTSDAVSIDHRRVASFAPGELTAYIRAGWDLDQNLNLYIEAAHRVNDRGAVFTWTGHGTSHEGFEAEWRGVNLMTVDGEMVSRMEVFDEEDLDAALAVFEELHPPERRLENAASQVAERFLTHFAAGDWDAMAEMLADNFSRDDRRRLVGAGVRDGRDAWIVDMRATAELWIANVTSTVIGTRGARLVLIRGRFSHREQVPEGFLTEFLTLAEINDDKRIAAIVMFDIDDIDAAFAELDARYIADEAAPYRDAWSVIAAGYAALNRYEVPPSAPDYVAIDHRLQHLTEAADLGENLRAAWDLTPELKGYVEVVHRLSSLGAVVTHAAHGTTQDGLDAEWRGIHLLTVEGGMVNRCEVFFEADLDAALAKFNQLSIPALRLKNAVAERISAHIGARDWNALAQDFADDYCLDDRRRVVNAGVMHGRDAGVENTRVAAEVGLLTNTTSTIIASRGERLTLERFHASGADRESIQNEALNIVEIGAEERIAAVVMFDVDDIDAAFAELDARYLAGEGAAHAQTWSRITRAYAALNRHQVPATTPDWVVIDHSRLALAAEASNLAAFFSAMWELTPTFSIYIEAVHRLSNLGAVYTHVVSGISPEGFEAEWRLVELLTLDGDQFSRGEIFDEADLDTALARFEELHPQMPNLENAASRMDERLRTYLAAREWAAMANLLTEETCTDDRRRIVNVGIRRGRDVTVAYGQAMADLGVKIVASDVVAIRGERLFLSRARWLGPDQRPEDFHTEVLNVVEIDPEQRIAARVMFDADDIDAAFAELEARYLAGEAAAYALTWSAIARECAAFNRHELTAVDYITVDHRPLPIVEAFSQAALRVWDVTPDFGIHIEAVHRLGGFGAVATYQANGTSPEDFDGEWRMIILATVEGDRIDRCEVFDESDLDAALVRFEELRPPPRRLQNAASRVTERCRAVLAVRDWDAMAEILAEGFSSEDRRRVVNSGIRQGRDLGVKDMQAAVDVIGITYRTSVVIATRGERLELISARVSNDKRPETAQFEVLQVSEIDTDGRVAAVVTMDVDDIDAAFEELDTRYLAGEAAAHAHTWSAIANATAGFNRHEMPSVTPHWVNIDHRRVTAFTPGDLVEYIRATWEVAPDSKNRIVAVHRLTDLGAVITQATHGTSQEGFEAEWREITLLTVEGDSLNDVEIFDEADLDIALARFEELYPQAPRLENAASQVAERFWKYFANHEWVAMAEIIADNCCTHDRRRVVSADVLRGRAAHVTNMRAVAEVGFDGLVSSVLATREHRLALIRICSSVRGSTPGEVIAEMLSVVEIDTDNRLAGAVIFDSGDIDAAFEELDARYLAAEASHYAHTWSVIARTTAAFNRHELPVADGVNIDNRTLAPVDASDLAAFMRDTWDLTPDFSTHIEAVHRLSSFGAVVTYMAYGTSLEGFAAEWRVVDLLAVEGDRISRVELFDEADIDTALARFDELERRTPSFGNAATRTWVRAAEAFNCRDVDGLVALASAESRYEDRRKGLRDIVEAPSWRKALVAVIQTAPSSWRMEVEPIAVRGARFSLTRECYRDVDEADRPIAVELLHVVELDDNDLMHDIVSFDPDDLDDAFAELTARWVASGEVAYPEPLEAVDRINATINRHDWDAVATHFVGAEYVNHRQLGHAVNGTIADWLSSLQTTGSLVPNVWAELAEVLARCAIGIVGRMALKGTSTDGAAIEIPFVVLILLHGERVTRLEAFDEGQRDVAVARLQELNQPV